jgi:hypothetical protein
MCRVSLFIPKMVISRPTSNLCLPKFDVTFFNINCKNVGFFSFSKYFKGFSGKFFGKL